MNIRNPLATALLMASSFATAQTPSFSMTGGTDMVEKCGTVPYRACTPEELQERARRAGTTGYCLPLDASCQSNFMTGAGASNPTETIAAYTPPPGTQWASPDCQRIPCRTVGSPGGDVPYDQQPGFIGPPAPPKTPSGPPPFPPELFQQELANAQAQSPNPVIDMGDGRYGAVLEDGTVAVCGQGQCAMPRPASDFPGLEAKIQDARQQNASINSGMNSLNDGSGSINGDNKSTPNKSTPGADEPVDLANSGRTGSTTDMGPTPYGNSSAGSIGEEFGGDLERLSGGTGVEVASAGDSYNSPPYMAEEVVKIDGAKAKAEADKAGYTYTRIDAAAKNTEAIIKGGERAFDTTNGRIGDPPVNEKYLGKIQAVAQ